MASHVLHVDSDCVFTGPATPDTYMQGDRPLLLRRAWANAAEGHVQKGADSTVWREPTASALGWDPPWETMVRSPQLYDARLYPAVRRHVSDLHGMDFDKYVLGCKPTFPYGFCEHNTLGAYALEWMADRFTVLTVPPWEPVPSPQMRQLWTHDDLTAETRAWIDETLSAGRELRPPPPPGPMTARRARMLGME
jgi:hypothetical protein